MRVCKLSLVIWLEVSIIVPTGLILLPAKNRAIKKSKIRIKGKVINRMFFKIFTLLYDFAYFFVIFKVNNVR